MTINFVLHDCGAKSYNVPGHAQQHRKTVKDVDILVEFAYNVRYAYATCSSGNGVHLSATGAAGANQ